MPYSVVQIATIGDSKKTMVVPETWVVSKNDRIGFVYWSNETCEKTIKELIADDRSTPPPQWKKQFCKIIFRTIPSLASAEKALAIWQKQFNSGAKQATPTVRSVPNAPATSNISTAQNKDQLRERLPQQLPTRPIVPKPNKPIPKPNEPIPKPRLETDPFGGFFTVTSNAKNNVHRIGSFNVDQSLEDLPPQLYDLVDDLRSEIISNQQELKRMIQEGFNEMRKLFTSLMTPNANPASLGEGQKSRKPLDGAFKVKKLMTVADVKRFEEHLKNEKFQKNVHNWIDTTIEHEYCPRRRIKTMVEQIFDEKLFTHFSWFGMYNKQPLRQYPEVRKLMEYIATTPSHQSDQTEVTYLLLTMMSRGLAAHRNGSSTTTKQQSADSLVIDSEELEPTVPTERLRGEQEKLTERNVILDENGTIELEIIDEDGEVMDFEEIIEHEEILQSLEECTEKDERSAETTVGSTAEFSINRITCLEELNIFDNELKDPDMQRKVHKWIDSAVVNRETDVEKRLSALLDRLMDRKVLHSLSWMNANSAKRPLEEYKNVIRLFEYASRTVIHQTIIYNHGYVGNFFAKRMEES